MINTHLLNISNSIKRQFKERLLQTLHTAETYRRPTCTTHQLSIIILECDKFRSPIGGIKRTCLEVLSLRSSLNTPYHTGV